MSKSILVFGLLLSLVAAYKFWTVYHRRQEVDLDRLMAAHAQDAVDKAKTEFSIPLDYTQESIAQVEKILATIYTSYQQKPVDESTLGMESRLWGCYIGEVIKKTKGGKWQRDSAFAGEGALPLVFGSQNEVYPCAWVYRRLTVGEENNVAHKFQMLVVDRDKNIIEPNLATQGEVRVEEK